MAKNPVHIFVVENSSIFNGLLEYIFSKDSFYRFIDFNSGEECIRNLHLEPDIVLLDYSLPGIDGHQTLLKIKKHCPDASVLMLMDDENDKHPELMLSAGASACVMKSEGLEVIIEKLEDYLGEHENGSDKKKPSLKNLIHL